MASKTLDKAHADAGWQIIHQRDAETVHAAGVGSNTVTVNPGQFVAVRRADNGSLQEVAATSVDSLNSIIESSMAGLPNPANVDRPMTAQEKINSALGTIHMAVSAGARASATVDFSGEEGAPVSVANVSSHPPILAEDLSKQEAALQDRPAKAAPVAKVEKAAKESGLSPE